MSAVICSAASLCEPPPETRRRSMRVPPRRLDALLAFAQGVGQAFEDGAVEVGAGVHFAEADDGALGFGAGQLDAGVPVRLQHQAHGAGRHGIHQFVEQGLGGDAARAGGDFFVQAELLA
jgi:hypothetical protein